jgi:hypothetical protein
MRVVRQLIAIGVGTLFFLIFFFLCLHRELGPEKPSGTLFGAVMALGAVVMVAGLLEAGARMPAERGFGIALAVEGGLLVLLTLIAWIAMGPTPLPV